MVPQLLGLGGCTRTGAAAAASEASASALVEGLGVMASIAAPGPSFYVDGDGDVQTHDGPVDKAKLATFPTNPLGSTGRNPEKQRVVKMLELIVPK